MRRIVGVLAAAAVGICVSAGSATAQEPQRQPVNNQPGDISGACAFTVHVGIVADEEFQTVQTLPDGTVQTRVTGRLVVSLTNTTTGKTVIENISGPGLTITRPNGTRELISRGPFLNVPSRQEVAQFGDPAIYIHYGLADLGQNANGGTLHRLEGRTVDVCALLA